MTELPRIPPTGPAGGIKAIKPVRKPGNEPRRPTQRERPPRKGRDDSESDDLEEELPAEDSEPGKGSSINLRV